MSVFYKPEMHVKAIDIDAERSAHPFHEEPLGLKIADCKLESG